MSSAHKSHEDVRVIVADEEKVRFFRPHGDHFHCVETHSASDPVNVSGSHADSMTEGRQNEIALAKKVVKLLDDQFDRHEFKSLVLVAAPQMLGEIRAELSDKLKNTIIASSDKNLGRMNDNDLFPRLTQIMTGAEK